MMGSRTKDLRGERFHALAVNEFAGVERGNALWRCTCDCGVVIVVASNNIRTKQSCGCLRDLTGKRFGRWLVLEAVGRNRHQSIMWLCRCDCGNTSQVRTSALRRGDSKGCGCRIGRPLPDGQAAFNRTFARYQSDAASRGYPFDLSAEQFVELTKSPCYYCGAAPGNRKTTTRGDFVYNGIDRADNGAGYSLSNCVPCCSVCNRAKRDLTVAQFIEMAHRIAARHPIGGGLKRGLYPRLPAAQRS